MNTVERRVFAAITGVCLGLILAAAVRICFYL